MTTALVPTAAAAPAPVLAHRPAPLDRLPGSAADDPFHRLLAGWMLSLRAPRTAAAYSADLRAWQAWCALLDVHPLAAERWHVDAWRVHLTTVPRPRTGTPASAATVARQLSAVAGFYKYGIGIGVLEHSPVESVQRPRVPDESQAVGLTTDELKRLLAAAAKHSAKSLALVSVLMFCGCRISEALAVNVSDFTYDHGHRVLRIMRKGNKPGRVVLTPPVVRALDGHLAGRTSGPIFVGRDGTQPYSYRGAFDQLRRLCRTAGLPAAVTPHSLRHSYATESLALGAALQDVQDALGHSDPRTTRRYDRSRNRLDRSPNYLLASALTLDHR